MDLSPAPPNIIFSDDLILPSHTMFFDLPINPR